MEKYDVIIVGAGPAGLNAAKILGGAKKKVLLLEKNQEIGPKVCAGGLTRKSIRYLKLPSDLIEGQYNAITFNSPHFRTVIDFDEVFFYTIDRKKLGQWQLQKLDRNFVEVRTETHITKIEKNCVMTKDGEKFAFSHLIGADGANSIVRRYLKKGTLFAGVAIQYKIPRETFRDFEVFMDSKFWSAWYSWIFPHRDFISIGYGYPQKYFSPIKAQERFEKWCQKMNIDLSGVPREAFMINVDYRGFRFGNIFLAGDAAGLASGYTGEGIYQALISGEEIAKIILDNKYKPKKIRAAVLEKRIHEVMAAVVILAWPIRNLVLDAVIFMCRIRIFGRTLIRILS